jgi:hypothetical protein
VYEVPFERPVCVIGEDAAEPLPADGLEVDVKVLIAFPPVAPAVNATVACPFPPVGLPIVGACGTVVAVIDPEADDAAAVPLSFAAVTVNVYEVLDARPVTVNGDEAPEAVNPPGDEVAVYVTVFPPVPPAVNVTVAAPLL